MSTGNEAQKNVATVIDAAKRVGFDTMKKYMPKGMDLKQLGIYMDETFSGRLDEDRIKYIQDRWNGKIVLKGIASVADTQKAVDRTSDVIVDTTTVADTVVETTIWTGPMAANSLNIGNVFKFHANGAVSNFITPKYLDRVDQSSF